MRALVQRVSNARVSVRREPVGSIGPGFLVFLGVGRGDSPREVGEMTDKLVHLRVFENEDGRFDRSLLDIGGEALVISQFTLYGDCRKGRRPSFTEAAPPEEAVRLYELFIEEMRSRGIRVASGRFGERMEVALVNQGPVTLWLEIPPGGRIGGASQSHVG
jgi:D-aminoacyl-tRNA deacylase